MVERVRELPGASFERHQSHLWEKAMASHSSTLAWKIPWTESLVDCSPWGRTESDTTGWLHVHFSLSCIGEGNGNPLQCSCLENPRDGGAWWAAVYGVGHDWSDLAAAAAAVSFMRAPPISFYHLWELSFKQWIWDDTFRPQYLRWISKLANGWQILVWKTLRELIAPSTEFFFVRNMWTWGNYSNCPPLYAQLCPTLCYPKDYSIAP